MNELVIKDNEKIENLIYEIRGKQVILDSDLARIYNCKNGTKEDNQAVKNNSEKYPERFSWVLTAEEWKFLRSKFLTLEDASLGKGHYRKYLPRVFTEEGCLMLSTILKTKIATETTIAIMDAFVIMIRYLFFNIRK